MDCTLLEDQGYLYSLWSIVNHSVRYWFEDSPLITVLVIQVVFCSMIPIIVISVFVLMLLVTASLEFGSFIVSRITDKPATKKPVNPKPRRKASPNITVPREQSPEPKEAIESKESKGPPEVFLLLANE